MRCDRYPGIDEFFQTWRVEIRDSDARDFAGATQPVEFEGRLDVARDGEVPPMKLHQIQPLLPQSRQGSIDDGFNLRAINGAQIGEVRNELCMNLYLLCVRRVRSTETADQTLDAGIYIRTVEGGDPRVDERRHVLLRLFGIYVPMITGEVPAAFDDSRNRVIAGQGDPGNHVGFSPAREVAVTCERVKRRRPVRVMRKRVGQFGSGQATSASVDIQSFGSEMRCLAGSKGNNAANE